MYIYISLLVFIAIALMLSDHHYHANEKRIIASRESIDSVRSAKAFLKTFRPKSFDYWLGPLQMLANWFLILAGILLAHEINFLACDLLVVWLIASRLRALEELGHMAIHGALGGSRKFSLFIANCLFQLPALKPSAQIRRDRHCIQHHPNVNLVGKDPGISDFVDIGFIPGISKCKFWLSVFFALTPAGIVARLIGVYRNLIADFSNLSLLLARCISIAITAVPFIGYQWWYGLAMFYLLPLFIVFPQFYWISQVVEHRWFVKVDNLKPTERELISCRPTDYGGALGLLVANSFFPIGDRYHMTHSLFPHLRWNYLAATDALMRRSLPEYGCHASYGLFFGAKSKPAAIDYLKKSIIR